MQQDFSAVKRNFKKKTPFTQWSNAYFSGGVFFNPPVSGIWPSILLPCACLSLPNDSKALYLCL